MEAVENREHQCTIIHLKEERVELFSSELQNIAKKLNLEIKDFKYRNNKMLFTLCGKMKNIKIFLGDFADRWNVVEMGVSEFSRVMDITDAEAREWYDSILKYQHMIMSKSAFESQIISKFGQITDVDKLKYLKKHFMDNLDELIQNRIDDLEGKEDHFTLFFQRQSEKQGLLSLLENSNGTLDQQALNSIKDFIKKCQ